MNMKPRVILLTLMLLAASSAAFAADAPATRPQSDSAGGRGGPQPGGPGGGRGGITRELREAINGLNLTEDQKTKIEAIFKKSGEQMETMRGDLELMEPRERRDSVRKFADGVREELKQVLDADQQAELQKKIDAARNNRGPTSGPTTGPAGAGRGAAGYIERLGENIQKLDLTDEQKEKIKALVEETKTKGEELRKQIAGGGAGDVRQQMRDLVASTREKLNAILTPDQATKLQELMRPPGGGGGGPNGGGGRGQGQRGRGERQGAGTQPGADASMMESQTKGAAVTSANAVNADSPPPGQVQAAGPSPGDTAPELALKKLDGSSLQLSSLKGRVIVLEFGSYSCPSFRNRAAGMEKLKSDYGIRAQFFVIYTREAHPAGEWDVQRNEDAGISVEQPRTMDARKTLAGTAREKLKITTPIALDSIGNDAAIAYGALANSAYVINRDGIIVARQQWFEPNALRSSIDEAIAARPTTRPVE